MRDYQSLADVVSVTTPRVIFAVKIADAVRYGNAVLANTTDLLGDEYMDSWCTNCGNSQKTDHLGTQACKKCGKSEWMDVASFKKYAEAQKRSRLEIGQN